MIALLLILSAAGALYLIYKQCVIDPVNDEMKGLVKTENTEEEQWEGLPPY